MTATRRAISPGGANCGAGCLETLPELGRQSTPLSTPSPDLPGLIGVGSDRAATAAEGASLRGQLAAPVETCPELRRCPTIKPGGADSWAVQTREQT